VALQIGALPGPFSLQDESGRQPDPSSIPSLRPNMTFTPNPRRNCFLHDCRVTSKHGSPPLRPRALRTILPQIANGWRVRDLLRAAFAILDIRRKPADLYDKPHLLLKIRGLDDCALTLDSRYRAVAGTNWTLFDRGPPPVAGMCERGKSTHRDGTCGPVGRE